MAKHKTTELEGDRLDDAVAVAEGFDLIRWANGEHGVCFHDGTAMVGWSPSRSWDYGGPIIERERIALEPPWAAGGIIRHSGVWAAWTPDERTGGRGKTPLVAAMRAYVQAKLGGEVELPGA